MYYLQLGANHQVYLYKISNSHYTFFNGLKGVTERVFSLWLHRLLLPHRRVSECAGQAGWHWQLELQQGQQENMISDKTSLNQYSTLTHLCPLHSYTVLVFHGSKRGGLSVYVCLCMISSGLVPDTTKCLL